MIAIMISIKPYWFAKILNGKKKIEVRKNKALARAIQKLIDKQGYAPILGYCTQDKQHFLIKDNIEKYPLGIIGYEYTTDYETKDIKYLNKERILNGKVPALLICRKVDEWDIWQDDLDEKLKLACLSIKEFDDYSKGQVAYAIHISKLEIFDKPKELSEFHKVGYLRECYNLESHFDDIEGCDGGINERYVEDCYEKLDKEYQITKAPQNYQWVEVEE